MALASPLMDHYNAVVLHFVNWKGRPDPGPLVWKGLADYVASGKGLVIVHFGCGALREWEGYVDVAGRIWDPAKRGHDPYGPFGVRIAEEPHAVTRGMGNIQTEDELYTCLRGDTPIQVLAEATSKVDGNVHPMALVNTAVEGRVFLCTLGHDVRAFQSEGVRALYRRATGWAAGLAMEAEAAPGP
jgi:type 1 glutamine amidotransferase